MAVTLDGLVEQFPAELHACRQRHKTRANTLLIVVVDADELSVADRRRQLEDRVKTAGFPPLGKDEPIAWLIPKRNIETWVVELLGNPVTENDDYKTNKESKAEVIRKAAKSLHSWSRSNTSQGQKCCPSLATAMPEFRKIC